MQMLVITTFEEQSKRQKIKSLFWCTLNHWGRFLIEKSALKIRTSEKKCMKDEGFCKCANFVSGSSLLTTDVNYLSARVVLICVIACARARSAMHF